MKNVVGEIEKNKTNVWKELKKAYPSKTKPIPTGVKNVIGKVITNPSEKKRVTLEHFEHRMRKRPVMDEVEQIVEINKDLFKVRLEEAKSNRSPSFNIKELCIVLKSLISGKSKDPNDYICELFGEGVIRTDLKIQCC